MKRQVRPLAEAAEAQVLLGNVLARACNLGAFSVHEKGKGLSLSADKSRNRRCGSRSTFTFPVTAFIRL
jgi:hypothetical protein